MFKQNVEKRRNNAVLEQFDGEFLRNQYCGIPVLRRTQKRM